MAIIPTTKGKIYAVVTEQGCTVSTGTGIVICSVEAGAQGYFVAPSNEVTVSDDAALVTATFKCALRTLRLLAGGDKLPVGYTQIAYLEATGTQYIDTGVFLTNEDYVTVDRMPLGLGTNTALFGAHAGGLNRYIHTEQCRINALNVTFWVGFGTLSDDFPVDALGMNRHTVNFGQTSLTAGNLTIAALNRSYMFTTSPLTCYLFGRNATNWTSHYIGRVYYFRINGKRKMRPAITPQGEPCMYDFISGQAFINIGEGEFIAGIDATAQINALLRNLPDLTGQEAKTLQIRLADSIRTEELEAYITNEGNNKNWLISHAA